MVKAVSIIMVTADWEKASGYVKKACKRAAEELGLELEEKKEDYEFLEKYGVKNEFGGLDIPQVFIKYGDGKIKYIMSRVPLTDKGKPDINKAVEIIKNSVGG